MSFRSILLAAAIAVFAAAAIQVAQPQPVAAAHTESGAVFAFAQKQLSKPYHLGSVGLKKYDCSGLVYRTYFEAGLLKKISGKQRRARGYFHWFKDHGLIAKNPHPGDLVVWAYKHKQVSHIGIFTGWNKKGQPMAISALTTGVAKHRVTGITVPFKAYLRVNLDN